MRQARRLGALGLGLAVAACAGGGLSVSDTHHDAPREMFISGYEKIEAVYIKEVNLGDLAVAGLTQVASLDPTITVARESDKVELKVGGKDKTGFTTPAEDDADGWGTLTADVLVAARAVSPQLTAKPNED